MTSELDKRTKRGGDRRSENFNASREALKCEDEVALESGGSSIQVVTRRSSQETAEKLNISRSKVERARTIIDNAEEFPDVWEDVMEGKKSIRGARESNGTSKAEAAINGVRKTANP